MINAKGTRPAFREGDEVILAKGTYEGTPGVFLRLKADANWADINERNGRIRSHPVAWLALAMVAGEVAQRTEAGDAIS